MTSASNSWVLAAFVAMGVIAAVAATLAWTEEAPRAGDRDLRLRVRAVLGDSRGNVPSHKSSVAWDAATRSILVTDRVGVLRVPLAGNLTLGAPTRLDGAANELESVCYLPGPQILVGIRFEEERPRKFRVIAASAVTGRVVSEGPLLLGGPATISPGRASDEFLLVDSRIVRRFRMTDSGIEFVGACDALDPVEGAAAAGDELLVVWNEDSIVGVDTQTGLATWKTTMDGVRRVHGRPGERFAYVSTYFDGVRRLDTLSGRVGSPSLTEERVRDVDVSRAGVVIVACASGRTFWRRIDEVEEWRAGAAHIGEVTSCIHVPELGVAISCGADSQLLLSSLEDGEGATVGSDVGGAVVAVSMSSDATECLAVDVLGRVHSWSRSSRAGAETWGSPTVLASTGVEFRGIQDGDRILYPHVQWNRAFDEVLSIADGVLTSCWAAQSVTDSSRLVTSDAPVRDWRSVCPVTERLALLIDSEGKAWKATRTGSGAAWEFAPLGLEEPVCAVDVDTENGQLLWRAREHFIWTTVQSPGVITRRSKTFARMRRFLPGRALVHSVRGTRSPESFIAWDGGVVAVSAEGDLREVFAVNSPTCVASNAGIVAFGMSSGGVEAVSIRDGRKRGAARLSTAPWLPSAISAGPGDGTFLVGTTGGTVVVVEPY